MAVQPDQGLLPWSLSSVDVLQELAVDPERGLDETEALRRRREFGRNQLQATRQRHLISILVDQFKGIVIVLLAGAGILAMLFSNIAEAVAIYN
jgi:Ca2+-transporting ATPase